jgi:hypothetical protein
MIPKTILAASAAFFMTSGPLLAGEFADWCTASAPDGADMSKIEETCACLEAATEGDADARASMESAGDIADRQERFAALSAEAQDAVSSCR